MSGNERVTIVTGASRGIGRATALRLAEDFGRVVLVARDRAALGAVAEAVRASGAMPLIISCDLREPASAARVVKETIASFGRIDSLVNNAGAVPMTDLTRLSDEEWADGLALKFHGARRLTLEAWAGLEASKGSVVFVSGSSAPQPKAAIAAVGTINAAVLALAKAFADLGLPSGITVNSVLPGPVMTDRRRAMVERMAASRGFDVADAVEAFVTEAGISRFGAPGDIAALVAFLVSPEARWMTGSALRMDGGEVKAL